MLATMIRPTRTGPSDRGRVYWKWRRANVARVPPTRPPTWPPHEMFGITKDSARLMHDEPERRPGERSRGPVLEDEQCAEDPVDRAGRADRHRERAAEQERAGRAGDAGDEVDEQEAPRAERPLDDRAAPVEDEHVQGDVEQARVQEHRGDEPVPLVLRVDLRADERALLEQLAAGQRSRRRPGRR